MTFKPETSNKTPTAADMLKCSTCKAMKPPDAFHLDTKVKRGRCYQCKECTRKKGIERNTAAAAKQNVPK